MRTRIIIIEDDDDLRGLMRVSLEAAGYVVVTQPNGNDARHTTSEDTADLYLIDINLGGISGLDICRQIKATHHGDNMPYIIMISANPDVCQLAVEACADDTLPKPFNAKQLLNKISEYLPQAQVA